MPDNTQQNRVSAVAFATAVGAGAATVFFAACVVMSAVFATSAPSSSVNGALATSAVSVVIVVIVGSVAHRALAALVTTTGATSTAKRAFAQARAIAGISRLLPTDVRDDYCEEWAAWMLDLRADGTPRLRRWIELLTIVLIAAPRLAITLRLAARRAVDR